MDAFFASVEIRARPELRDLPVVVGGSNGRGVVAAASYPARVYGIRSAMSMAQALRLCPQLVVITPHRSSYSDTSAQIMRILADFTPVVEPLSLDEAFLDVSGAVGLFGRPADIARQIRQRIYAEQQLTCSVGVAPIKAVAKLASGSCKPDGLRVVSKAGVLGFLHPLPVTALWGVGARTAEPLRRLGIRTVGELAATPLDTLRRAVGSATASHLHTLANGRDDRVVAARPEEKSISTDRTLARDLLTEAEVARELLRGAGEVAERLRHAGRVARTVGIKIRFADFTMVTRVRTLAEPTDTSATVYAEVLQLYRALKLDKPRIRLVGVKAENLRPAGEATQLTLDLVGPTQPGRPHTGMGRPGPSEDVPRRDGPTKYRPTQSGASQPTAGQSGATQPAAAQSARVKSAAPPPGPVRSGESRFGQPRSGRPRAAPDQAIDALVARFGESVVRPASLLEPTAEPSAGGRHGPGSSRDKPGGGRQITNRGNLPGNPSS